MGYSTYLDGEVTVVFPTEASAKESEEIINLLEDTRRVTLDVDPKYGEDGEFYFEFVATSMIVDNNKPPGSQPSLYSGFTAEADGSTLTIYCPGDEFRTNGDDWMEYFIGKIFKPRGGVADGNFTWNGDEDEDMGTVYVVSNEVKVYPAEIVWPSPDDDKEDESLGCMRVKYFNPSVLHNATAIMFHADMSSNDMGNMYHAFFYDTLNDMVADGGYDEEVNQHDLAILTDLVSNPVGTEDDEAGTKLYPELYMFSDHVTIEGDNDE